MELDLTISDDPSAGQAALDAHVSQLPPPVAPAPAYHRPATVIGLLDSMASLISTTEANVGAQLSPAAVATVLHFMHSALHLVEAVGFVLLAAPLQLQRMHTPGDILPCPSRPTAAATAQLPPAAAQLPVTTAPAAESAQPLPASRQAHSNSMTQRTGINDS